MQPPTGRRGRQAAAAAAAAVGAVLALALLALPRSGFLAAHKDSAPEDSAPEDGATYVPDVPGAAEAREWLLRYNRERRQRGMLPRWPESISLPACEAPGAALEAGAPAAEQLAEQQVRQQPQKQQLVEQQVAGQQGEQQRPRHLVLATVGDSWGPGADQNRWGARRSPRLPCTTCHSAALVWPCAHPQA